MLFFLIFFFLNLYHFLTSLNNLFFRIYEVLITISHKFSRLSIELHGDDSLLMNVSVPVVVSVLILNIGFARWDIWLSIRKDTRISLSYPSSISNMSLKNTFDSCSLLHHYTEYEDGDEFQGCLVGKS